MDCMINPNRTRTISIHAPHEGERLAIDEAIGGRIRISIHAPHEGERLQSLMDVPLSSLFQSTLPTRGSDLLRLF